MLSLLELSQSWHIDELVQERHKSSSLAMEFCLSCTNPLIYVTKWSGKADMSGNSVFQYVNNLLLHRCSFMVHLIH